MRPGLVLTCLPRTSSERGIGGWWRISLVSQSPEYALLKLISKRNLLSSSCCNSLGKLLKSMDFPWLISRLGFPQMCNSLAKVTTPAIYIARQKWDMIEWNQKPKEFNICTSKTGSLPSCLCTWISFSD